MQDAIDTFRLRQEERDNSIMLWSVLLVRNKFKYMKIKVRKNNEICNKSIKLFIVLRLKKNIPGDWKEFRNQIFTKVKKNISQKVWKNQVSIN